MGTEKKRTANTFRARVFGDEATRTIAFICECGSSSCHRTVLLTLAEYERRRPDLVVHADHERASAVVRALFERAS